LGAALGAEATSALGVSVPVVTWMGERLRELQGLAAGQAFSSGDDPSAGSVVAGRRCLSAAPERGL